MDKDEQIKKLKELLEKSLQILWLNCLEPIEEYEMVTQFKVGKFMDEAEAFLLEIS